MPEPADDTVLPIVEAVVPDTVGKQKLKDNGKSKESKERSKEKSKAPATLIREDGKSLLPFSRVQKIMKADNELPMVAKEATFLISLATEEFIKRISEASQRVASRDKRVTVQQKDIASVVRKADEFLFLEEIIPWSDANDVPVKQKPVQGQSKAQPEGKKTMLDRYVTNKPGPEEQRGDIIVDEDSTMQTVDETQETA